MKKFYFIGILIFIILFVILVNSLNKYVSTEDYLKDKINIDIKTCNVILDNNTHDGFHGDGYHIVKARCNNDFINQVNNWNELPLSTNIHAFLYGDDIDGVTYVAENRSIPEIENGYYYFIDRQNNLNSDIKLFKKGSFNFTLAIFDIDTNIFYYYEYDT